MKTVWDIRLEFKRLKLFPVITLRDDIFEILRHAERTRWRGAMVDIGWTEDKIKVYFINIAPLKRMHKPHSECPLCAAQIFLCCPVVRAHWRAGH